jgi:SHS2 domain-containing protein
MHLRPFAANELHNQILGLGDSVMAAPRWEHYEHQADIGVRGFGASPGEAFEQAAVALTAVITDPATVVEREAVPLACTAPDLGLLLADWLNAVIYAMATRRMLFHRFAVQINGEQLSATAWGEPVDVARHRPAVEVKGATYTDLAVRSGENDEWIAQCVVDV